MLETIRDYVRRECQSPANVFGPSFFDQHLAVVADYATRLAGRLGADPETVEMAAWLHDISAVRDPATLPNHAVQSAEFADRLLAGYGCPMAARVARCIASHSAPLAIGAASPEEVCLSNADALSRFARPAYWCYFAFGVRKLGFEDGRQWLEHLFETQWNGLVEPAKELAGYYGSVSRAIFSACSSR